MSGGRGIAWVPAGAGCVSAADRAENLETGFAVCRGASARCRKRSSNLFPILKTMLGRRGGDLSGGHSSKLSIARALVMKPRLIVPG